MNTFGHNFRVTTFGESHGAAIGVVIDGCPPGFSLSESDIQPFLDKRRPGQNDLVTPRKESDEIQILSGIFDGKTLGTPICLLIHNTSMKSADYDELKDLFRPGHADRGYMEKYGIRDHRGGGRSSGRETAARVAAGGVAALFLAQYKIRIIGTLLQVKGETTQDGIEKVIRTARDYGESVGGIIGITVSGCPPGLGDPVFGKLDALIAYAMMGIGGVKAVEIGSGITAAVMTGSQHNDQMTPDGYLSNNAGGILGGISTGQEILVRLTVKPTPSVRTVQKTIDTQGFEKTISVQGRHDPCIAVRIVPVAEAMMSLVLIDAFLEQRKINPHFMQEPRFQHE
ncbi:MAG: chorismate synthase [Methanomicrobiales archaeon]|nr:chorismate synthase [Methanomicrobiales archaeon]